MKPPTTRGATPSGVVPVKRARGRPAHEPNDKFRNLVKALKVVGATNAIIADTLKIPLRTLERHYATELTDGKNQVLHQIGLGVLGMALKGDLTASFFALKAWGGVRDRGDVPKAPGEGGGEGGGVPKVNIFLPDNGRPDIR